MRAFETTHPWIRFSADLRNAPTKLWVLLGEAASKIEHIAGIPLQPDVANELHRLYLAKGVLATTAIEGNTLTEEQVRARLDGRLELPPSREYLGREVENIAKACGDIWGRLVREERPRLSVATLKEYNGWVLNGLELEEGVVPGEIRTRNVGVGRYLAPQAADCEHLLERLCDWLEGPDFHPGSDHLDLIQPCAILQAIVAHLYLAWIHAFGDGNGRTARLVEFHLLLAAGFPTPSAHLLSNHYNLTRSEYYRKLDHASRSGGDILPFIEYAVRGLVDGLREQIERIRGQQLYLAWKDFIFNEIRATNETAERRRKVVLALTSPSYVPAREITNSNPAIARLYGNKTGKTLTRDLNWLLSKGLLEKSGDGYRSNVSRIIAFLPARKRNSHTLTHAAEEHEPVKLSAPSTPSASSPDKKD